MKSSLPRALPRLIGVVHLPALAGAPGSRDLHPAESLQRAGARAVEEARQLEKAGFEGVILENFGDVPFHKERVGSETVASLAVVAAAVREAVRIPIGINVLRNDAFSALSIAAVTGCDFVRVNVLAGAFVTDQGIVEGRAAELIRERDRLGADVEILADVQVKHARPLGADDGTNRLELEIEELALRAGASGVIVTGKTTGRFAAEEDLRVAAVASAAHRVPVWVGSGASPENLALLGQLGVGVIVGSALRKGGRAGEPLDAKRLRDFVQAYRQSLRRPKTKASKKPKKKAARSKRK